ncbi:MAG: response regulator [Oligoflexia bacterium]|nr:response regulator [Oligoflexia bacterium]
MSFSEIKTLVVDDSIVIRSWTVQRLKELGFVNIDQAESGDQAFEKIVKSDKEKTPFKLVLSDWRMDNGDGPSLFKKIRSDHKFDHIVFIMITAESEKDNVIHAISLGVANYLVKPFEVEDLKDKILSSLERVKNEI